MSVITMSEAVAAQIAAMRWSQLRLDVSHGSAFGSQSVEVSPPLWKVAFSSIKMTHSESGAWKAMLMLLRGQTNQLAVWDVARPAPIGTMRGTMILSGVHAQGASALSITTDSGQASRTLLAGDLLGIGSGLTQQVVMVTADAVANGSGAIAVSIEPPLRNAHASLVSVTWDKPKALFRRTSSPAAWDYEPQFVGGILVDLIEDVRA